LQRLDHDATVEQCIAQIRGLEPAAFPRDARPQPQCETTGFSHHPRDAGPTCVDRASLSFEPQDRETAAIVTSHPNIRALCALNDRAVSCQRKRERRLGLVGETGDIWSEPLLLDRAKTLRSLREAPEWQPMVR